MGLVIEIQQQLAT